MNVQISPFLRSLTAKIHEDLRLGVETGDYAVPSVESAGDLSMGAKIVAIRRMTKERGSYSYIQAMTSTVLRSFCVTPTKADKSAARAYARLLNEAPSKIFWWRPID